MVKEWWENGGGMVGEWWENGGGADYIFTLCHHAGNLTNKTKLGTIQT